MSTQSRPAQQSGTEQTTSPMSGSRKRDHSGLDKNTTTPAKSTSDGETKKSEFIDLNDSKLESDEEASDSSDYSPEKKLKTGE